MSKGQRAITYSSDSCGGAYIVPAIPCIRRAVVMFEFFNHVQLQKFTRIHGDY